MARRRTKPTTPVEVSAVVPVELLPLAGLTAREQSDRAGARRRWFRERGLPCNNRADLPMLDAAFLAAGLEPRDHEELRHELSPLVLWMRLSEEFEEECGSA